MIGAIIAIIDIVLGIILFPKINHVVKKLNDCNGGCTGSDICMMGVFVSCFAIIAIPLWFMWKICVYPFFVWQEKRIQEYEESIKT